MSNNQISIIDTHVHFFDFAHPELKWVWLAPDFHHPIIGNIDAIKSQAYLVQDFRAESRFAGVEGVVHVQAAIGSPNPVTETVWLTKMNETSPIPIRIVADSALGAAGAITQLEDHAKSNIFVGVRDFNAEPMLASKEINPTYEESLKWMTKKEMVFDLDCEWMNMPEARKLAERHPDLPIVLEHIGFPRERTDTYFQNWKSAIEGLAKAGNVTMKISGVAMTDPFFTKESLKRWIDACLDAFGPDRCVIGSNWPVDRLYSSYDPIMRYYREYIEKLSVSEQEKILNKNAAKLYKF
jgi:predicted TIM-barrel fold metal-dependent hydrolase